MKNIIIVSAHPDDETLGLGGTIFKHVKNNDNLYWLITTSIFEREGYSKEFVDQRKNEIRKVSKIVGFKKVFLLNYPTSKLSSSSVNKMIPKISEIFNEVKPEVIYCVNRSDAHSDHKFTFNAINACTKSFRYPFIKKVLLYECISETEFSPSIPEKYFQPNYFVDVTEFLEKKLELIKVYSSELGDHPFPRSLKNIKSLAIFRGATVGVKYAEAFQLIKYIVK